MAGSAAGIPALDLPSLDPTHFAVGKVSQQDSGPVSMNMSIRDGQIIGWSKLQVTKVV